MKSDGSDGITIEGGAGVVGTTSVGAFVVAIMVGGVTDIGTSVVGTGEVVVPGGDIIYRQIAHPAPRKKMAAIMITANVGNADRPCDCGC